MSQENLKICQQGIKLLQEHKNTSFNQKEIVEALEKIGCKIAKASINNVIHYKKRKAEGRTMSKPMLKKIADGIQQLILFKFRMAYNQTEQFFVEDINLELPQPPIIPKSRTVALAQDGILYHIGGRRDEEDKIQLMQNTQAGDTIIELGVRLHSFSQYFLTRRDDKFKLHIEQLLRKGINLHCLLLNPNGLFAKNYFINRAKQLPLELEAYERMPSIIRDLKQIKKDINSKGYQGKMALFQYDSPPQYHALVARDKMYITHYIYGLERRNGPVLEIHQQTQPELFEKYLKSVKALCASAQKIE